MRVKSGFTPDTRLLERPGLAQAVSFQRLTTENISKRLRISRGSAVDRALVATEVTFAINSPIPRPPPDEMIEMYDEERSRESAVPIAKQKRDRVRPVGRHC